MIPESTKKILYHKYNIFVKIEVGHVDESLEDSLINLLLRVKKDSLLNYLSILILPLYSISKTIIISERF